MSERHFGGERDGTGGSSTPPQGHDTLRLAVLISGGGTTLQAIADRIVERRLRAKIALVISSRDEAGGLQRAAGVRVPSFVVSRRDAADDASFSRAVFSLIRDAGVDLVCLAGFMSLLSIPDDFAGRVVNVHPALLPAFGGRGMYGRRVHQAVLDVGCKVTGCTVHFCDNTYDTGPILLQQTCAVEPADDAATLAERVQHLERNAYPEAIELIRQGRVRIQGSSVRVAPAPPLDPDRLTQDPLLAEAERWCIERHAEQERRGGGLYSEHPIAVAHILARHGIRDRPLLAAAFLHDLVEDTPTTIAEIDAAFGPTTARLVDQMTLPPDAESSFEKKHATLAAHAREMEPLARALKLADRLHNLSDLHLKPPPKRRRYAVATLGLLAALSPWPSEADPLAEAVLNLLPLHMASTGPEGKRRRA